LSLVEMDVAAWPWHFQNETDFPLDAKPRSAVMDSKTEHDVRSWLSTLLILPSLIEEDFDFNSESGQRLLAQAKDSGPKLERALEKMKAELARR